jgi:predicted transcriptional regulator
MTISLRLDTQTEKAIERYAKQDRTTKSQLIRDLISQFIQNRKSKQSAWELGKDLFDQESSGDGNLSENRKALIGGLINAKKSRY